MVADEILKSRPFSLNHGGVLDTRDIVGIKKSWWWLLTTHNVVADAKNSCRVRVSCLTLLGSQNINPPFSITDSVNNETWQ